MMMILLPLAGCDTNKPATGPQATLSTSGDWLDAIIPDGRRLRFAGQKVRVNFERRGQIVAMQILPKVWRVPRVETEADAPPGLPVLADPPAPLAARWSELRYYSGWGKPYRIRMEFPEPDAADASRIGSFGRVKYFFKSQPDDPHEMDFDSNLYPRASAVHLVLIALSRAIKPGRTEFLIVHKNGKDYLATIDAEPRRREVRFPKALLWSEWKPEELAKQSVFIVDDFEKWPASRLHVENFSKLDPADAEYVATEALE